MLFKKNWFTNCIWLVSAVLIILNLFGYAQFLLKKAPIVSDMVSTVSDYYGVVLAGTVVVSIAVFLLLFFLFRWIAKLVNNRFGSWAEDHNKLLTILEAILVVLLLASAGYLRVVLFSGNPNPTLSNDFYFEMSMIRINENLPILTHNGSYLYIVILSFVMRFLGNKVMAAVALNLLLQMFTILFGYMGIRKLFGFVPALVSACVFSFYSVFARIMFDADAQNLLFLLFSLSVYFISRIYQVYERETGSANLVFSIVLAGLFTGLTCYSEPYCLILFLFGLGILMHGDEENPMHVKALLFVGITIASTAFLLILFTFQSMRNNVDLINPIRDWLTFLTDVKKIRYALYTDALPGRTAIEGGILAIGAFYLIPGYVKRKYISYFPLLLLLVIAPVPFCKMGYLEYEVISVWIWACLAGNGFASMLYVPDERDTAAVDETPVQTDVQQEKETKTENKPEKKTEEKKTPVAEKTEESAKPQTAETNQEKPAKKQLTPEEKARRAEIRRRRAEREERLAKKAERERLAAEKAKQEELAAMAAESQIDESQMVEPEIVEPRKVEPQKVEPEIIEPELVRPSKEVVEEKKVQYIPNPLPVPKKHIPKKVDFAIDVSDDDSFDFDFDVTDDDDFDV